MGEGKEQTKQQGAGGVSVRVGQGQIWGSMRETEEERAGPRGTRAQGTEDIVEAGASPQIDFVGNLTQSGPGGAQQSLDQKGPKPQFLLILAEAPGLSSS